MTSYLAHSRAHRIGSTLEQFGNDPRYCGFIGMGVHFASAATESMSAAFTYRRRGATASSSSR